MKEALKLALEALESGVKTTANRISWTKYDCELMEQAITAIKEALAQPEQKPVEDVVAYHSDGTRTVRIAPKRPWVGLTDEETDAWFLGNTALKIESGRKIAKEIEAALRSKNT